MHALTRILLMPRRALAGVPVLALGPVALVEERATRRRHRVIALARPVEVPRNAVTRSRRCIALQIAVLARRGRRHSRLRRGFRGLALPLALPLGRLGGRVRLIPVLALASVTGRRSRRRLSRSFHNITQAELHRDELLNLGIGEAIIPGRPLAVAEARKHHLAHLPFLQLEDIQLHAARRGRIHAVTQHQVAKRLCGLIRPDGLVRHGSLEGEIRNLGLRIAIEQMATIVLLPIQLGGSKFRRRVTRVDLLVRIRTRIELVHIVRHLLRVHMPLRRRLAERVALRLQEGPNVPQIVRFEQTALIIPREPRIERAARPGIIVELHEAGLVHCQLHQLDVAFGSLLVLSQRLLREEHIDFRPDLRKGRSVNGALARVGLQPRNPMWDNN